MATHPHCTGQSYYGKPCTRAARVQVATPGKCYGPYCTQHGRTTAQGLATRMVNARVEPLRRHPGPRDRF